MMKDKQEAVLHADGSSRNVAHLQEAVLHADVFGGIVAHLLDANYRLAEKTMTEMYRSETGKSKK